MKYPHWRCLFSSKMINFVDEKQILTIMKRFNILLVFFLATSGLYAQNSKSVNQQSNTFGETINEKNALSSVAMSEKYAAMAVSDTLTAKFSGRVTQVCKVKGCWMKVQLENGNETMVRFKDYGFFMPHDIKGKEVVMNGFAFVEEMSVEDQQHYAKDAGKTNDEINAITEPKKSFGFEADGVLIKE